MSETITRIEIMIDSVSDYSDPEVAKIEIAELRSQRNAALAGRTAALDEAKLASAKIADLEARLATVTADFVAICGILPAWCGEGSIARRVERVVEVAESTSRQLQALGLAIRHS